MKKALPTVCILVCVSALSIGLSARSVTPYSIKLDGWKLQIPGPKEIKDLSSYSSEYFERLSNGAVAFHLDCADKGHTPNTKYVRSELRHKQEWKMDETRSLTAVISVDSKADPDKVTVLQIHGITEEGEHAPPLLRIAVDKGDLFAHIKKDNSGDTTEHIKMLAGVGGKEFQCTIKIEKKRMIISVNGSESVSRDMSFWKYPNYFKAGCYPQALKGKVNVLFTRLDII